MLNNLYDVLFFVAAIVFATNFYDFAPALVPARIKKKAGELIEKIGKRGIISLES